MNTEDVRKLLNQLYDTRQQFNESISAINKICSTVYSSKKRSDAVSAEGNKLMKFYNQEKANLSEYIKSLESKLFELNMEETGEIVSIYFTP